MSRVSMFSAPFLLGFDAYEEPIDRLSRAADGYPPYNIERTVESDGSESFLISIAVAGFAQTELEITQEDNQLLVRGKQKVAGRIDGEIPWRFSQGRLTAGIAELTIFCDGKNGNLVRIAAV